jgi:hypothetical protein
MAISFGTTACANAITADSVLRSATTSIAQRTSAHVEFVAHSSLSSTTEKIVVDVGSTSGSETLVEGKAELAIRLTPAYANVRGILSGLTMLFGLTASEERSGRRGGQERRSTPISRQTSLCHHFVIGFVAPPEGQGYESLLNYVTPGEIMRFRYRPSRPACTCGGTRDRTRGRSFGAGRTR